MTGPFRVTASTVVELAIRAIGQPVPQGSHVGIMIGKGAHRRIQVVPVNAAALAKWRGIVKTAAVSAVTAAGWLTLTGPVVVEAVFLLDKPRTVRRLLPTVAPDLDKLQRALGDALTDAQAIADDALIVRWVVEKRYVAGGQRPGVRVLVRPADEVIV